MTAVYIARGAEIPVAFGNRRRARKKALVAIRAPDGRETVRTSWGFADADPSLDFVITYAPGDQAVIKKTVFAKTYEPVADGWYPKKTSVELVQVPPGVEVTLNTMEGEIQVAHPDFIAIGINDEVYPNSAAWVAQSLEWEA